MGTYAALSAEDKQRLTDLLQIVRPLQAEILRLSRKCEIAVADWNSGASAIVTALDAAEEIPNSTGLSGARELTKENLAGNLMAYITTCGGFSTAGHIANMLPAAGATNIL